jgi:hypothetical protein
MIQTYTIPVVLKHPEEFQKEYIRGRKQTADMVRQDNSGYYFLTVPFFFPERDIQESIIACLKTENHYTNNPSDWILDDNMFRPFFTDNQMS